MAIICDICRVEVAYGGCPDTDDHDRVLALRYAEALIQIAVEHGPRLHQREGSYTYWASPSDTYWVAALALGVA